MFTVWSFDDLSMLNSGDVPEGDGIFVSQLAANYVVATASATDHHVTTSGGMKLYVSPYPEGFVTPQQFGFVEGVSSDQSAVIQAAVSAFPWVHFPPMDSGVYYMGSSDLILASASNPRNDVRLTGSFKGANGPMASRILFGSDYGMKVNGGSSGYCLFRLTTDSIFFGPIDSVSRTTPIFSFTGLAYWSRANCHFQGDTLKQQPVLMGRRSIGITSRDGCNIWGGLVGEDFGTVADPLNCVNCVGDNHNGSRYAGQYVVTSFSKIGGMVQSCGDGFDFSSAKAESCSGVVVDGVYFENNKHWDGSEFTGRDITLGGTVFVRGVRVSNNYHAQLTTDNAFTSGQGKSTISPVSVTRVQGGEFTGNFWTSVSGSSYIMLGHVNQAGIRFPNNLRIEGNTDLYTTKANSVDWQSSVTEAQKFAIFDSDSVLVRDWNTKLAGITKTARSPLVQVSASGAQWVPIMGSSAYGAVKAVRLLCADGFAVSGTLDIGVLASATFYVSGFSLGTKASYTTTNVTMNNNRILPTNGPIVAKVNISSISAPGNFVIELDYCDVI